MHDIDSKLIQKAAYSLEQEKYTRPSIKILKHFTEQENQLCTVRVTSVTPERMSIQIFYHSHHPSYEYLAARIEISRYID